MENHSTLQVWPKSNPLQWNDKYIQEIRSDRPSAWRTMDRIQFHCTGGGSDQGQPKKKKCKKAKWLSEEALQIAEKWREVRGKGEKEKYIHLNAEFQRIARRDKKAILSDQCKEIEENNIIGKTRGLFKKTRYTKGTFH